MDRLLGALSALLFAVLLGCQRGAEPPNPAAEEAPDGPPWFEDVTQKVGVDFVHDPGPIGKYEFPQIIGSGCAVHDLDGDGRPDLLFLTNGGPNSKSTNKLYRQEADGRFTDVTVGSGLDFPGYCMGVAIGDVNNDGRPDVLITLCTGARLFLNRGGMKFVDVSAAAGIRNPLWGSSAVFLDYDRDGWLDLFIVNYVEYEPSVTCQSSSGRSEYCSPKRYAGTASKLFRNRGLVGGAEGDPPAVSFEDVSVRSRVGSVAGPGLGVIAADFDGDGWPDILVANDGQPNRLWMNKRDGTFAEEATLRGVAYPAMGQAFAGMGIALGDVDGDGLLDLYITHLASESNTLWRQSPRGQFRDVTGQWGLNGTKWRGTGFGTVLADFDQDGRPDLAVANGAIARTPDGQEKPGLGPYWGHYGERNQVFANTGSGKFRDVSLNNPAFCGYYTVARGLACGDIDGDGAPDLVVTAIGEKARVFRNVTPNRGHWLTIRAFDPKLRRDALGAEIGLVAGGTRRVGVVTSSAGYLAASPPVVHLGLGPVDRVDSIDVAWPDGTAETFPGGPADRVVELRKGSGTKR
jgi:hypothetical protein